MRRSLAVMVLLLSALVAHADGPIAGPKEFPEHTVAAYKVPAGGQLLLKIPAGVSVHKHPDCWCVTGKPGTYRWEGYWIDFTAQKADVIDLPFKITKAGPGPDPGPEPGPDPVPPEPDDNLTREVRAAYDADSASDKAASARSLAALWKQAANLIRDPARAKTPNDFRTTIEAAARTMGLGDPVTGKLPGLRKLASEKLKVILPTDLNATIPVEPRGSAGGVLEQLAAALEKVSR